MIALALCGVLGGLFLIQTLVFVDRVALRRGVGSVRKRLDRREPRDWTGGTVFVAVIVVGGLLRLLWVVWATRAPVEAQDPRFYLEIAEDFANGFLPRFAGLDHSAYWPPGYPALLAPFVWFADRTGWISPAFMASLVNVAAGTATIWLSGRLAAHWFGTAARNVAALLVAICPAIIYFTATAHTETVFTTLLLAIVLLISRAAQTPSPRRWLVIGLLVGFAFLVRSPAVIALVVPAAALRVELPTWRRPALRATALVVVGASVLLVPWMIRNGVQVGVWTPASTNNAAAACYGHNEGVVAEWEQVLADPDLREECFGGSPYDDIRLLDRYGGEVPEGVELGSPDEPRWYTETMGEAIGWAIAHPLDEIRLSAEKVWVTWHEERRAVDLARSNGDAGWAGRWEAPLEFVADLWLWVVGLTALAGLVLSSRCRRAAPVWLPVLGLTVAIAGGVAEPHYRYPVVPLVAVLAAGTVVARRSASVS